MFNNLSIKSKSQITDLIIILCDLIIGTLILSFLESNFNFDDRLNTTGIEIFAIILMYLSVILYAIGLIINKQNFIAEKPIKPVITDWIALGYNSIFMLSFLIILFDKIVSIPPNLIVFVIILGFLFIGAWVYLHWYIIIKITKKTGSEKQPKRKIVGLIMIFPFISLTTMPSALVYNALQIDLKNAFLNNNFSYLITIPIALTLLTWFTTFTPRKMMKSFLGVNIKNKTFFVSLFVSYVIKLVFIIVNTSLN